MRQLQRVQTRPGWYLQAERDRGRVEHHEVVAESVVGDQRPVAHPAEELLQDLLQGRRAGQLSILQPGDLGDPPRKLAPRAYQALE